jgi:arginase
MPSLVVPFFMGEAMPFLGQVAGDEELVPEIPDGAPTDRMAILYDHVAQWVAEHPDPIVYSGDCVSAIGVLAGLQRRGIDPTLLWFDAHGDFHTWDTTRSGFLGGMPLAMITGRGEQTVVAGTGLQPLPDEQVVLVDARDLDPGEDEAVAASGMRVAAVDEVPSLDLAGPLHVHVDVDVVDPAELPAVNYPARGGPSLASMEGALAALAATGRVAAFSVSSWNPELPEADRAAAATARLASYF